MAGAGTKMAGTGTYSKDGKVGPSLHHAAKQNHLSVASLYWSEALERAFTSKGLARQSHSPWPWFLPVPQASAFRRRREPAILPVSVSASLATHARVSS